MNAKKLFALILALTFLVGTAGLAVAQEKKMDKPAAKAKVRRK